MKNIKRMLSALLILAMMLSFAACNSDSKKNDDDEEETHSKEYTEAVELIEKGSYEEACKLLYSAKDNKDCEKLLKDFKVVYTTGKRTSLSNPDKAVEVITYTYDSKGNLLKEIDGEYTMEYTYDSDGNCLGEKYIHDYDGDHFISYSNEWTYDSKGNCIKRVHYGQDDTSVTEYTYNSKGDCIKEECEGSATTFEYVYDSKGKCLIVTAISVNEKSGHSNKIITEHTYDKKGNCIETKWFNEVNDESNILELIKYTYDEKGNCVKKFYSVDYRDLTTEYTYNQDGSLAKEVQHSVHKYTGEEETEMIEYSGYKYFYCPAK